MHCQIYPVHVNGGVFHWKWRCDDKRQSARAFELFYECVEDARSHGASVDLEHVHEEISAGGTKIEVVPQKVVPQAKRG